MTARELMVELSNIPGANLDEAVYILIEGGEHNGEVMFPVQGAALGAAGIATGKPTITVTGA